jgi:tripartite-type tricarboxylate transporter receptor subunit TctC
LPPDAAFHCRGSHLMRLCRLVASAVLMLSQLGAASAQEWPTRHITAIVPFGPGNSVDIVGRLLVARMSELLGQQIIVENIGGAGGSIGTTRAARAAPDGSLRISPCSKSRPTIPLPISSRSCSRSRCRSCWSDATACRRAI